MTGPDVVLVDRSREPASTARLVQVGRALQTQVDRDFSTVWGARARVVIASGTATPGGAWTVAIVDEPVAGLGIHLARDGSPHAEVRASRDWTLAASHVLLEMAADPRGQRFMEGPGIGSRSRSRRVRYLVEVCDPCELFHYEIDGVRVSDFVTPDYYRAEAPAGTAFDFLRRLRRPLEVPRGGCLSWQDMEEGRWHLRRPDGSSATSGARGDAGLSTRDDRNAAFADDTGRHDLDAIWRAHSLGRRGPGAGGPGECDRR
jgi:hypothetical protein